MLNSNVLEVVVGLVFVYLTFSLVCSVIVEWIARARSQRAITLKAGITQVLGSGSLASEFHQHPLITGLIGPKEPYPSYLDPGTFAEALMELAVSITPASAGMSTVVAKAALPSGTLLSPLEQRLINAIVAGSNSAGVAQAHIENWFKAAMERVSGWYKRDTKKLLAYAAVLVTLAFGIDTVRVARELNKNATLRSAVIVAARKVVETGKVPLDTSVPIPLGYQFDVLSCFGLPLTMVALSFGAPFWFDVLNKLVNLRQTGRPPSIKA